MYLNPPDWFVAEVKIAVELIISKANTVIKICSYEEHIRKKFWGFLSNIWKQTKETGLGSAPLP